MSGGVDRAVRTRRASFASACTAASSILLTSCAGSAPASIASTPAPGTQMNFAQGAQGSSAPAANLPPEAGVAPLQPLRPAHTAKLKPSTSSKTSVKKFSVGHPLPAPDRYITMFFLDKVPVYNDARNAVISELPQSAFPRVPLPNAPDKTGVPIFETVDSFYKIALPRGATGWVTNDVGRVSVKPCANGSSATRAAGGGFGAGATDAACATLEAN